MEQHLLSSFLVTGVTFRKSNSVTRSKFALNKDQVAAFLMEAKRLGVQGLMIISTCNRTEFYTYQPYHKLVVQLLSDFTGNSSEDFYQHSFKKKAGDAIHHLLEVSTGLDSQILGDYEIVGQIKQAYAIAKKAGTIDTFLDRLVSASLQCSKKVKTETRISSGTTSVAFASINFLKQHYTWLVNKKIVLIGTGKIGTHACKNLLDYTDAASITLINRTDEKAIELASQLNLSTVPFQELPQAVAEADIIIVSTAGTNPLITPELLPAGKEQVLIDLSIPNNIDPDCGSMAGKRLINVDGLSTISDATLASRRMEIPLAQAIIEEHFVLFMDWLIMRRHAPYIAAAKHQLLFLEQCDLFQNYSKTQPLLFVHHPMEQKVQRTIKQLAENIKKENRGGCHVIDAINHFITPGTI
ncbi:MAG: glutamyl-tRNA reductase [Chitinophagaceae bacterium]